MKEVAEIMKALSEEVRLRLLLLLTDGELCVCDLIGALDLPQSTISRHLAYLKNSGWVDCRRQGGWMHYRLAAAMSQFQAEILGAMRREFATSEQARRDGANLELRLRDRGGERLCDQNREPVAIEKNPAGQPIRGFFRYIITLCGHANETCPYLPGRTLHRGFDDPPRLAAGAADEEEALGHYRRVRDEIRQAIAIGHQIEKGAMTAMGKFSAEILEETVAALPRKDLLEDKAELSKLVCSNETYALGYKKV